MARKGWESLKADYRERLERNGISRADYERGASLQAGRGHEKTPEHPKSFDKERFQEYAAERERLTRELARRKEELFGDTPRDPRHGPRFHEERSLKNIRDQAPPLALMRWALTADRDELIDAIREDSETFAFLGYH